MKTVEAFKQYVEERYPQLLDPSKTHFKGYDFVQIFESNEAIDKYVTNINYGTPGNEKIGLAVVFDGNDPLDFKYAIRQNATNFNTWEAQSQPAAPSTPDTRKLLNSYSVGDFECGDLFVFEGPQSNSCTGRYIYNGFLTTQRLVQDFMMVDTGAKDEGYFVSEHGVRCKWQQILVVVSCGRACANIICWWRRRTLSSQSLHGRRSLFGSFKLDAAAFDPGDFVSLCRHDFIHCSREGATPKRTTQNDGCHRHGNWILLVL